jgi:flagellar L-ring protein precursor FlgH
MNMKLFSAKTALMGVVMLSACGRMDHVGKPPSFSPANETPEHVAMLFQGLPTDTQTQRPVDQASLWSGSRQSLLGDRRATKRGDILTVVIEIDEEAEISNDTKRSRSGSESLAMPQLLGLPQRLDRHLPEGATAADAVDLSSTSQSGGKGSVKRSERLELRVAATVVDVLPNGVLAISGTQELRVNFELRELLVTGYVRPDDISRQNEITYDKIASARVSYGGRGQITDVQQPRYGQQVLDVILPF